MMLGGPGKDSNAGFRRKYLDNLMNIWQADYIESAAMQKESGFSFLRFIDSSSSEIAKTFKGDNVSMVIDGIDRTDRITTSQAVYDDGTVHRPQSMLLVPGTTTRFPLKEVTNEKVMAHLCNVADETFRSQRLHVMDPMYDIPVCAPPIEVNCSDRTFQMEQTDKLFDA